MATLDLARWSEVLLEYLGPMGLGHTVLLLALLSAAKALRRYGPTDRHFVGLCWLIGLALVAVWPLALGRLELPVLPTQQTAEWLASPVATAKDARSSSVEAVVSESRPPPAAPTVQRRLANQVAPVAMEPTHFGLSAQERVAVLCAGLYLLVVAVLLTQLAAATLWVARAIRGGSGAAEPEVAALFDRVRQRVAPRSRVTLRLCDTIKLPATLGLLRHWVLLPRGVAAGLSAGDLDRVLTHELAHVRRNDFAVNLLQQVVKRVAFFNPLVWVFDRWLRNERERACDEFVLAQIPGASAYAECLTRLLVRQPRRVAGLVVTAGMLGFASSVRIRVASILGGTAMRTGTSPWTRGVYAAIVLALVFGTSGVSLVPQPAAFAQEARAVGGPLNELLDELRATARTRADVVDLLGRPEKYAWGRDTFEEDNLPDSYLIYYETPRVHFWMRDGKLYETRVYCEDYEIAEGVTVGTHVEQVLAVIGDHVEEVQGQRIKFAPNVLYRDAIPRRGNQAIKGHGYLFLPAKQARVFFRDDCIYCIYMMSEKNVVDRVQRHEGRTKPWPLNEMIEKVRAEGNTREAVLKAFGRPWRYSAGGRKFDENALPRGYFMWYRAPYILFSVTENRVGEIRILNPGYVLPNELRVGSSLDDVVAALGQRPEEVRGKRASRSRPNVLFREPYGTPGSAHMYLGGEPVLLLFKNDVISQITLLGPENRPKSWPLNDMIEKVRAEGNTREAVLKVFGKPYRYSSSGRMFDENDLPSAYFMSYRAPYILFAITKSRITGVRILAPGYVLKNGLRVGSSLDDVAAALGHKPEEVRGERASSSRPNVLFREPYGTPGTARMYLTDEPVVLMFRNDVVAQITLLGPEGQARIPAAEQQAAMAKALVRIREANPALADEPILNTLVRELEKGGRTRSDVEALFGPPERYSMGRRTVPVDRLPSTYTMWYNAQEPRLLVFMKDGLVHMIRILSQEFELTGGLRVGASIQQVVEAFGGGLKEVRGQELKVEPNVLYREYVSRGKKVGPDYAYLYWPERRAVLYMGKDSVYSIDLLSPGAMAAMHEQNGTAAGRE